MATNSGAPDVPLVDLEDLADVEEKKTRRATAPPKVPWKNGAISEFATKGYRQAAVLCRMSGSNDWADVADEIAVPAGIAWEKVAKRNEMVKRMFDRLMTTGDFSELLWAHFPLFVFTAGKVGLFNRVMTNGVGAEFAAQMREETNGSGPNVVNMARG